MGHIFVARSKGCKGIRDMGRIELMALIAVAATGAAACEVRSRNPDTASAPPNGSVDTQIRADLSGVRAEIELGPGADLKVEGNDVAVDYRDGELRARIGTEDNRTISVTRSGSAQQN